MKKETSWKKWAIALLLCGLLCIGGLILTDEAKQAFWWNFWLVGAIFGGIGFVALIIYLFTRGGGTK